ncbi:hypothetical protein [Pseudoxanthomonas sp.]|jgi:hypothetical protein|uniref:hypothetical protein n=1 Tax=Pseudoxanthomonas sp. TaxID=1871049 RepID=UPI002E0DA3C6|nr:hypothetical protein [Pseudoxanthomonas sp.]
MTRAEQVELVLVPVLGIAVGLLGDRLPASPSVGALLLAASCLLLLQGLARDLWLLSQRRKHGADGPARAALCLCAESTVGVAGVVAGLALLGSPVSAMVPLNSLLAGGLTAGVLAFGFAIRDLVIEARPFRIRRERDHLNIVVAWRRAERR